MIIDFPKSPQPPFQGGVRPICPTYDAFGQDTAQEVAVLPLEKGAGGILSIARKMLSCWEVNHPGPRNTYLPYASSPAELKSPQYQYRLSCQSVNG